MITLTSHLLPERIQTIPQPPDQLYTIGANLADLLAKPCICIVGSRKVSAYGKQITTQLAGELARAGVVIVSGLAIGVDSIAHRAVLDAGGLTIAVLPSGLDAVYPASHRGLARQIIAQGGALVTEYPHNSPTYPSNFIARNRIASGLSDAVIITEAAERSGTLSTARFALEQGRELLAVPGNITSPTSVGTNNLIKAGAAPVTGVEDILHVLGITSAQARATARSSDPHEQTILDLLQAGETDGAQLLLQSSIGVSQFNQALTMLEIKGLVRPLGGNQWSGI
jgi:DNA processing protein